MKNIKRLFLLAALVFLAMKVFAADIDKIITQNTTQIVVVNK